MKETVDLILTYGWQVLFLFIGLMIARNLIGEWVKKLAHAGFDEDLARAKEEFRTEAEGVIESIRAENRVRENLQSVAMASFVASRDAAHTQRLEAIGRAWKAMQALRSSVPWYIWTVDTVGYREDLFGPRLIEALKGADYLEALQPVQEIDKGVLECRPFLSGPLYFYYSSLSAFLGRAVTGTVLSYRDGSLEPWFDEGDALSLVREALDESEFAVFQQLKSEKLIWLSRRIETKFIEVASEIISGDSSASEAVALAEKVLGEVQAVVLRNKAQEE